MRKPKPKYHRTEKVLLIGERFSEERLYGTITDVKYKKKDGAWQTWYKVELRHFPLIIIRGEVWFDRGWVEESALHYYLGKKWYKIYKFFNWLK